MKLITKGQIDAEQSGCLRTIAVSIVNESTKTILDTCPEPHLLPGLIEDLWEWLRDTKDQNPYARAFAFHFIAVTIHPFADGNGRTIRLFQQILLQKSEEFLAQYIPSESMIMKYRTQYYLTIRESKSLGSLTPMLEFLAKCYAESAREVVKSAKVLFEKTKQKSADVRRQAILKIAKEMSQFKIGDIESKLPSINRKTLLRDIQKLVTDKKLSKSGVLKGTSYQLTGSKHVSKNPKAKRK